MFVEKGDVEGFVLIGIFCSIVLYLFFNVRGYDCILLEGFFGYLNMRYNWLNRICGLIIEGFWKLVMYGYVLWM